MKSHSKDILDTITCPFGIDIKSFDWDKAKTVLSVDDKKNSVIIETIDKQRFLVHIPAILYDSIWKSGEENVIEQDFGFNEMT